MEITQVGLGNNLSINCPILINNIKSVIQNPSYNNNIIKKVGLPETFNDKLFILKNYGNSDEIYIPESIIIDDCKYKNKRMISKGMFGEVHLYCHNKNKVTLKIPFLFREKQVPDEINLVECIKNSENLVKSHYMKISYKRQDKLFYKYFILMDYYPFTLSKILKFTRNRYDVSFAIIKQITKILSDLYDDGYCYYDLKANNVLCNVKDDNTLDIILGDMGGITKYDDESLMLYRPPFESEFEKGYIKHTREYNIVWTIGILLIKLVTEDTGSYVSKSIDIKYKELKSFIRAQKLKNKKYGMILEKILSWGIKKGEMLCIFKNDAIEYYRKLLQNEIAVEKKSKNMALSLLFEKSINVAINEQLSKPITLQELYDIL